jgi:outer membrane autotransporter protein
MVAQHTSLRGKAAIRRDPARRRIGLAILLLSTTALTGLAAGPARAADTTWDGSTSTDWFDPSNWDTNAVPTAADNVFVSIDQSGNFPVVIGTGAEADHVLIGVDDDGFLGVSGVALNAVAVSVGSEFGTQGLLGVVAGGSVVTTGDFIAGDAGNGIADFGAGTNLTVGGITAVAKSNGPGGELNFHDGATGVLDEVAVATGQSTQGRLKVESGADVDVTTLVLGGLPDANATVLVDGAGSTLDIAGYLSVGDQGIATLNVSDGGQVVLADNSNAAIIGSAAGSNGTVNVANGMLSLGNNGLSVGNNGTGALNISAGGSTDASYLTIGDGSMSTGTVTVSDTGSQLLSDGDGDVGFSGNGMLIIANEGLVSINSGAGALHVATNVGSIGQLFIGDTGVAAGVLEAAAVEFGAGAGSLIFNHVSADYAFDTGITGAGTIYHQWGSTKLNGDASGFSGQTNVYGGSLYVNGVLGGLTVVNDTGTLGGSGTLTGPVTIGSGGTIAPGNSIGTINVGAITMASGSTYEVELNDSGNVAGTNNDIINATGAVIIDGGTVHVTAENGTDDGSTYIPGVTYHILYSADSVVGTFDALTDDYAFLNFTLNYNPSNVFLTSSIATSFCLTGMTANQCATGDGLFSLGAGSLFTAVVNLSGAEAPGALDQLSGELHASARAALIEDSRFVREAALLRLEAAFGSVEQGDGAAIDHAALWSRAFGSWGNWDGDGNAAGMDRDIGGFFLGADALVAGDVRLGVMGGYSRSSFDVDGRASSGSADTWTLGVYGGGDWNAFSLKGGAAYSWQGVDTTRSVAFTGFADSLSASYDARTAQVYGEAAYALDAGPALFEPFANLAYVDLSSDDFTESGGGAALAASGDDAGATFTTLGLRAVTPVALGGMDATLRGMLGWRHAFGDLTPEQALAFSGGDVFTVAGVPVAEDALALDAGFDMQISANATLGLSYSGQFGSGFADQGVRADLAIGF